MALRTSEVKSINRKDKTIELADGRSIPLPPDLAFEFLGSEAAREKKKGIKESTVELNKSFPLGQEAGAFKEGLSSGSALVGLATKYLGDPLTEGLASIKKGKGQEGMSFFERFSENLQAVGKGRAAGQEEIGRENPKSFMAGKIGGVGLDLAAPVPKFLPKNPLAQGAILGGALSAGAGDESLLTNPMQAGKEILGGAALGAGVGAIGGKLEKVSQDRAALRKYPEILAKHKEAGSRAEKQFLTEMARKLDSVQTELRGTGIPKSSLMVDDFINTNIGNTAMAGTSQARGLTTFIKSLEKSSPNDLNAFELKNLFSALEGRLATATAEEAPVLNAFRQHLVTNLPIGASNVAVKHKYGTRLFNSFEKQVDSSVNSFLSDKKMIQDLKKFVGDKPLDSLAADLKRFVKSGYDKVTPSEFMQDLSSGNLQNRFMWFFDHNQKIEELTQKLDSTLQNLQQIAPIAQLRSPEIQNLMKARNELSKMRLAIENNISKNVQANSLSASIYERDVLGKVSSRISNAVGIPNPLAGGRPPTNLRPVPTPPPSAPQVGRAASFFETPNFYRTQIGRLTKLGKGPVGLAKLGYLAKGLPKAGLGAGIAAGAGGLTAALRGVTSPTALGAFARGGIQRGSIRMIVDSIAQKYPSYQNGVLTDPQDRRAAASEIEQDQDISLEDKAVLQANINRGQNLERLIKEDTDGQ